MVKRSSQPLLVWFLVWDVAVTAAAWVAAYFLRFDTGIPLVNNHQPDFALCFGNLPLVVILALVSYRIAGQYQVHRLRRFREELVAVAKGVGLMALLVMATNFARQYGYESRLAMVMFGLMAFLGVLTTRRLTWTAIGRLRAMGYNQSHALIVGTGRLARRTARSLEHAAWMGIQTVAYADDYPEKHAHTDKPVVGPIADLPRLVHELHIEHVFIALPLNRYADARRVFDALSQTIVDVRLVADVPALSALALTTSNLHGMTFIGLRESPYHGLNVVVKRVMDVVLSAAALLVLSPLMAAIAVLVKLTSPGPVLYRQERCGLNGQSFDMLKFRTMRTDAETNGPVMTQRNDPRRTRLGALLRVTNLDELPQLFNVLRGDMSLVGPRPERPVFVNKFKSTIPNYMARHAVKCGMTGWAQVNGWRGNSSLRKRVQYDLYYITHWNPLFDLRILVLTAWRMLFGRHRHAY
jgi:Undecaprenyl-phosphate glucose phosphotransferase